MTDVHLINHTHWDREWFLTHEYTTAWVPALIDSIAERVRENGDYEFLFDGQTLAIEDLLNTRPEYRERVAELVGKGRLGIGPCYSQPDWRMVSGELHVRNLLAGLSDAEDLGGAPDVAWLVDTFGHISQAPQLLAQSGIDAAYVWRGVPQMVPVFKWRGADGTEMATIDLFGGYRNLYGITKTADIALHRLVAETDKLAPWYDGMPVPLFDGYDLDTDPEDPERYYATLDVPDRIDLHASSPRRYAEAMAPYVDDAPVIEGELLSGKFGSTFPGSLSARTYLKVLHHDCEIAIHRRIEPLIVLAQAAGADVSAVAAAAERASRTLLQNGVHDCLCGVSIDQVHERMDRSYHEMLSWADETQRSLAAAALGGIAPNTYSVSTHAMTTRAVVRANGTAFEAHSNGIGIEPVTAASPIRTLGSTVERFDWSNEHYEAVVDGGGLRVTGTGRLARFVVRVDDGDTYSSEPGPILGELTPTGDLIHVDESDLDSSVRSAWAFTGTVDGEAIEISATVEARFDASPIIDLTISLDSTGVGFRVDAEFETGLPAPTVHASMPFDVVERAHDDDDLFGQDIDPSLAGVLMGQRETGYVTEWPFHDYVAMSANDRTHAVLAKGPRGYRSSADGVISIALRRSVEWLAKTGLKLRSGDAGPAMYVPGARCERVVEHRLGFAVLAGSITESGLAEHSEAFHNPPMIIEVAGTPADAPAGWSLLSAPLATTACVADGEATVVRLYNPLSIDQALAAPVDATSIRGAGSTAISVVKPKQIVTIPVVAPPLPAPVDGATVDVLVSIASRVGATRSTAQPAEIDGLVERIAALDVRLEANAAALAEVDGGAERYRLTHAEYVLDRERLELALSLELNRRRAATTDVVSIPDDPDPVIAELGADLNDLRVKRRIYDYVVQALD